MLPEKASPVLCCSALIVLSDVSDGPKGGKKLQQQLSNLAKFKPEKRGAIAMVQL